jgi:hypothetical protein
MPRHILTLTIYFSGLPSHPYETGLSCLKLHHGFCECELDLPQDGCARGKEFGGLALQGAKWKRASCVGV